MPKAQPTWGPAGPGHVGAEASSDGNTIARKANILVAHNGNKIKGFAGKWAVGYWTDSALNAGGGAVVVPVNRPPLHSAP